jgi:TolB protein
LHAANGLCRNESRTSLAVYAPFTIFLRQQGRVVQRVSLYSSIEKEFTVSHNKSISQRKGFAALLLCLAIIITLGSLPPQLLLAQPPTGAIAYVRPNDATGDEIRLIRPDGSADQVIWSTGKPDPEGVYDISSLSWKPDSSEVAFASSHEKYCSINSIDLYSVDVSGQGYRRITQGPGCAALATYPQGRVEMPVRNSTSGSLVAFVYFQGAPSFQLVTLPPLGTATVVFDNVADFGSGQLQVGAMVVGSYRDIDGMTAVDVMAGGTVRTGEMALSERFQMNWREEWPTWRQDGSKIGYVHNRYSLVHVDSQPVPLSYGDPLLTVDSWDMPDDVMLPQWGPTPATANQMLYVGKVTYDSTGIYLVNEGSATIGQKLVSYSTFVRVLGLAWLPDGSGFIYSATEYDDGFAVAGANIYEYSFATGQATRLTAFEEQFTGKLNIAPDGQQIVFELSEVMEDQFGYTISDPDLWIVSRDGSGQRLLVENGRSPVWSRQEPQPPAPQPTATPTQAAPPVQATPAPGVQQGAKLYLPLLQRSY